MRLLRAAAALMLLSLPAAAAEEEAKCKVLKLASLPVEFAGLQPTLPGKFNGIDLRLLMDTGATTTIVFPSGIQKAGLTEVHSDIVGVGIGGASNTSIAVAKEAQIGPSHGKNVRFLAVNNAHVPADGLLGADYLFRTDLEMLLRDNQVIFLKPENCDDKSIAYWDADTPWVESRDFSYEDLRQKIEVKINGHTFKALLDSGAMRSVLDLRAAAWIGLTPDTPGVELVGQGSGVGRREMTVWRGPIDAFEIGPEAIRHTQIQIADLFGAARDYSVRRIDTTRPDLILGADFIRAHRLLISRSQHRLYFTYLGGLVFSLEPAPQQP